MQRRHAAGNQPFAQPGDHLGAVRAPAFTEALVAFLGDDGGS